MTSRREPFAIALTAASATALVVAIVVFLGAERAQAHGTVAVSNATHDQCRNIDASEPIFQTFRTSVSTLQIIGVDVFLATNSPYGPTTADITVSVLTHPQGVTLGSATLNLLFAGPNAQPKHFDFASPIGVTPGGLYALAVAASNNIPCWAYQDSDVYANGNAYFGGVNQPASDTAFRVYRPTPPPVTPTPTPFGQTPSPSPTSVPTNPPLLPNPPLDTTCNQDIVVLVHNSGFLTSSQFARIQTLLQFLIYRWDTTDVDVAIIDYGDAPTLRSEMSAGKTAASAAIGQLQFNAGAGVDWVAALALARTQFPHRPERPDLILMLTGAETAGAAGNLVDAIEETNQAKADGARIVVWDPTTTSTQGDLPKLSGLAVDNTLQGIDAATDVILYTPTGSGIDLFIMDKLAFTACPDSDADYYPDAGDNCPNAVNSGQEDTDSDDIGDACDLCPSVWSTDQSDVDSDGLAPPCDNCPDASNNDQADAEGDGIGDLCDNCPNWQNTAQNLPPWTVPADDQDCDGFSVVREQFMGTDQTKHCNLTTTANDEAVDFWPSDFNDSRSTNLSDLILMGPSYNKFPGDPAYNARFDLNASTSVNLSDVILLGPFYNKSCG